MALAAGLVAAVYLGAVPFSRPSSAPAVSAEQRAALKPHYAALAAVERSINRPELSVVASAGLASHLLNVRRLETVFYAIRDREKLAEEVGPGQGWIELFDFVALDLLDFNWNNSLADLRTVALSAEAAGYRLLSADHAVLLYGRPALAGPAVPDPLGPWRVKGSGFRVQGSGTAPRTPNPEPLPGAPGIRLAAISAVPLELIPGRPERVEVDLVLEATADHPPDYQLWHVLESAGGATLATRGPILPVAGNRPTSWWKKGESWRMRYTVELPAGISAGQLSHRLQFEPVE
jgi:hypothetical protein